MLATIATATYYFLKKMLFNFQLLVYNQFLFLQSHVTMSSYLNHFSPVHGVINPYIIFHCSKAWWIIFYNFTVPWRDESLYYLSLVHGVLNPYIIFHWSMALWIPILSFTVPRRDESYLIILLFYGVMNTYVIISLVHCVMNPYLIFHLSMTWF